MKQLVQSIQTTNYGTYINGNKVPDIPHSNKRVHVVQIDNAVYANGYELINARWKRTLRAMLYCKFG